MNTCKSCMRSYTTLGNLKRHLKVPCKVKVTEWKCTFCNRYYAAECSLKTHMKHSCKKKHDYLEMKKEIPIHNEKRLDSKKKLILKPKEFAQNTNTGHTVIFDDMLEKLSINMGPKQALDFLLTNFLSKNYEKIITACYLFETSSEHYPMACSGGNHFRFLDDNGSLIDDPTGDILVKKIINNIQNALLKASYLLIKKYIGEKDTTPLYEVYDIRTIQNGIYDLFKKVNHNKMKRYLAKRILNPNHYFFPETEY
jgi:hypothetical protein